MNYIEKIRYFPVSFYSVIMGLLGSVVALEKAAEIFGFSMGWPLALLGVTATIFGLISVAFLTKMVFYRAEFLEEFAHPVKLSFFPTFSISLLLFAVAILPFSYGTARIFWLVGTLVHLIFTVLVMSQWIKKSHFKIEHLNPAWFIPVVGNLLIPIAGVSFIDSEPLWFFFSIGMVFWVVLMTIVMYRIFYHEPLHEKLLPTLFILIAPPSVGCISYIKLAGQLDNFSRILYYFALFMALLLVANLPMFMNKKFYLSKWAYTFPLAALSIASALIYHKAHYVAMAYLHGVFLLVTLSIVLVLAVKTLRAIVRHEICVKD